MKDTYDLNDDAPRYVIEALMAVDRPLSSYDLADNYDPPKPNNLAELRNEYRDESGDVGRIGDYDVKEWLIVNAVQEINDCNDGPSRATPSSCPENRRLYERHGFQTVRELTVADCPALYAMWRPPTDHR